MKQGDLRLLILGAFGGIALMLLMGQGPMAVRSDGIQFPDGTVQTSADTRRSFFVTDNEFIDGINALGACGAGFHMASLWEILDVSNLRYATESAAAYAQDDSGEGPPSGVFGWIRTGSPADSGSSAPGLANCQNWTQFDTFNGTQVALENRWDGASTPPAVDWLGPWETTAQECSDLARVWCIQD